MRIDFNTRSADDYRMFLNVRKCPIYHFSGTSAIVPDEYATSLGLKTKRKKSTTFKPCNGLFDYQRDITATAIAKRKYAIFADCGLGKTMMILEYARHVAKVTGGRVLIVSPLMVCNQTVAEAAHWYGERNGIDRIRAMDLQYWLDGEYNGFDSQIAVTNYEAIREGLRPGKLAGLILDESSMLKSHYGAWGTRLIELGRGLEWNSLVRKVSVFHSEVFAKILSLIIPDFRLFFDRTRCRAIEHFTILSSTFTDSPSCFGPLKSYDFELIVEEFLYFEETRRAFACLVASAVKPEHKSLKTCISGFPEKNRGVLGILVRLVW